jgi:transposase
MKKYKLNSNGNGKKVSNELKGRLAHYLSLGLSIEDACKLSNCNKDKLELLRIDSEFEEFILECMLRNKEDYLKSIKDSAQGGYWQASAWFLERKYPEEFGKRDIVRHEYEIKIKTFQKILIDIINKESPDIRARLLKRIRDYKYDGDLVMDNSFQPKQLGKMEIDIDED